jgi:hypothetical protein
MGREKGQVELKETQGLLCIGAACFSGPRPYYCKRPQTQQKGTAIFLHRSSRQGNNYRQVCLQRQCNQDYWCRILEKGKVGL